MKRVIKQSVLALVLLMAAPSYSNVVDSIVVKNNQDNNIVSIERLKAGTLLKIKDESGIILHKEKIKHSGFFTKSFDLSKLPDATYYFELDDLKEIRIIPVVIKDQQVISLKDEETTIAKPVISSEGNRVYVQQNSDNFQDVLITIYYNGSEIAYKEEMNNAKNIKKTYDFKGSLSGEYTIVVNTEGRTFSNKINIPNNAK